MNKILFLEYLNLSKIKSAVIVVRRSQRAEADVVVPALPGVEAYLK